MRAIPYDRYLFAAGLFVFGTLNLAFGAFNMQWQPIAGIPFQSELARVTGAAFVLIALGLLVSRVAAWAAVLCAAALASLYWLPQVVALSHVAPSVGGYLPISEDTAMTCGALVMAATTVKGTRLERALPPVVATLARIGFGLSCVLFGVSHFVYADFTAQMIPGFVPFHLPFAYITGCGHLLAGLAIMSGVMARLAATLEAIMMSLFVVLVHIPMLIAGPKPEAMQIDWTMLAAATTLSASAWAVARSLSDKPWMFKPGVAWQSSKA
jgi:uncharacterized membrane protein YphA (DoxX/SURF4 family)